MKAIEFMMSISEMCKAHNGGLYPCTSKDGKTCPLAKAEINCDLTIPITTAEAENMQAIVEKWKNRNSETNGAKFADTFGIDFMTVWGLCDTNAQEWANQRFEK